MSEKTKDENQVEPVKTPFTDNEKQIAISSLKNEVRTEVFGWLKRWRIIIIGGFSLCSILGFITLCFKVYVQVKRESTEFITSSITEKFAEPNIQNALQNVASQEAKSIITEEVRPEITKIKQKIEDFETYLAQSKSNFESEYLNLSKQVSMLEARNKLFSLSDRAVNEGNRQAYEELMRIANDASQSDDIRSAAKAEWIQVKGFYVGITRVKGRNLARREPDGTKVTVKGEDLTTQELIQALLSSNEWTVRVMAAGALKDREEKGVPEALLQAVNNDQRLDVVKEAIDSFESITGYTCPDIFDDVGRASKWWRENKAEVEPKLKERNTKSVQGVAGQ